ncbi:MAG: tetratricopeptide repeat protein, partial [Ignavibacteria bacterium]|nr:tetratricopeptide repeat protein [Ignavibacteria bacterium]
MLGPGGAGKTRLAMQVGADLIDDFANGVFIAELAPVTDPDFIPDTLLNSFGIKEEAGKTDEATLKYHLKDKELLLILDNCEHLINESALITETLLSCCPKLKTITTSRESLNCSGEMTYSVPTLSHPDISVNNSPQQLSQYESVRLFIERALAVNMNFRVTNENAKALAEICSRLDGIPLAIELAAARVKVLSVEKICERLNDRFSLLTGGRRTALPRQQTLKALIDWSYDLLSENEKILWERLSVFTGGWTLESAEEICSDEKIKVMEILDLLNALTEKSIIIYDIDKERYLILETLKQYGEEKLRDSGGKIDILSKHLHYFMEYAEAAELKLKGNESKEQLDRLEEDHGNIQSAIIWAAEGGDKEEGARLAGALHIFWAIRGHCSIGTILLESILDKIQNVSKSALGKVLYSIANLALEQSDYEKAQKYSEENLALSRETKDKTGIGKSLTLLGHVELCQGNYVQAQKYYEESLSLSREIGDKLATVICLLSLGEIAFGQGNYEESQKFFEEGMILSRETGDKRSIAISLLNQGNLAVILGNYKHAQKFSEESMVLCREIGYKRGIGNSFHSLGCAAHHLGNFEQAQEYYKESILLYREIGNKRAVGVSFHSMG